MDDTAYVSDAIESYGSNYALQHHGIKGQKWGVRRYQNDDGSLTEAGRKKYGYYSKKGSISYENKHQKAFNKLQKQQDKIDKQARKFNKKAKAFESIENPNDNERRLAKASRHTADVFNVASKMNKDAMNKSLKELGMSKNEQAYRKAVYDYNKVARRNNLLLGPIVGSIFTASVGNGRQYIKQMSETAKPYGKEMSKYSKRYARW